MAPVVLKKEIDGFLVNRLQYAMLQEVRVYYIYMSM